MNSVNKKEEIAKFISEKLREHFRLKGMKHLDVAEILGTSKQNVSNYLNGTQTFGPNAAEKWHDAFGFRVSWLRTGKGPMFDSTPVQNNTAGGDMIINSPGASTASTSEGDVRVYKDLYEKAQAENLSLRAKLYKLMDRLAQNGLDCDCD